MNSVKKFIEAVAYLDIGAGGYLDLGSALPEEQLLALPNGRHVLGIIGTYGIDGYVSAPVAAAPGMTIDEELAVTCVQRDALDTECARLEKEVERLLALIDASPKGGSHA